MGQLRDFLRDLFASEAGPLAAGGVAGLIGLAVWCVARAVCGWLTG